MGLFTSPPQPVEDHGHGLLAEFEEIVVDLVDRASRRTDVVRSRLAALEAESGVLADLAKRLHVV